MRSPARTEQTAMAERAIRLAIAQPPIRRRSRRAASALVALALVALALGELERSPRFGPAVFLALDHARVAGEKAALLERPAQIRLEVHQRLGQAVTYRAGLARQSSTGNAAGHVVLAVAVRRAQRLLAQQPQHRPTPTASTTCPAPFPVEDCRARPARY